MSRGNTVPSVIRMGNLNIYCKGCILKARVQERDSLAHCIIATYNKHDLCPCRYCLVKVICNDKSECNERVEFISMMEYGFRSEPNSDYPNGKEYEAIIIG